MFQRLRLVSIVSILFLLSLLFFAGSNVATPRVSAAPLADSITVTDPGDSGPGTLRDAMSTANSGDTITFGFEGCPCTITLTTGELVIAKDLTINGLGADQLTLSGSNTSRIFNINSGATVTISGVTISGGSAANGGGISNAGTLNLNDSSVSSNTASANGGGIYNTGTLNGNRVLVSNNAVTGNFGGGIANIGNGALTLTSSTLSGNQAADDGAGIYNNDGAISENGSTPLNRGQ